MRWVGPVMDREVRTFVLGLFKIVNSIFKQGDSRRDGFNRRLFPPFDLFFQ